MKIAAVQMVSSCSLDDNLERARALIERAAAAGAEFVALPENFPFMGRQDADKLALAEAPGDGPVQRLLASEARRHGLWILGGTLPLASDDPMRVGNTALLFDPQGRCAARYDKIHLFRFSEEGPAGEVREYDEARVLRAGTTPVACDITGAGQSWRLGLSVCYDLRFPELYRALMTPPCDLIAVPSAFTVTTGRAHWELLLRARAVENQCYVIAPAQGGLHENGRRTWGHTVIIDPWGEVLACEPEGDAVVIAEMDRERIRAVRSRLPALAHRRLG